MHYGYFHNHRRPQDYIGFGGEYSEYSSRNNMTNESKHDIEHRPSIAQNLIKVVGNFLKSTAREMHKLLEAAALAEETISGRNKTEATFDWTFSDNMNKSDNITIDSLGVVYTKEIKQQVWKDTFEYIGKIPMERLSITKEIEMGNPITDPSKVTPCAHNYSLN